tara:strand:- start:201 stop:1997 length:1797 start_codon:yes stop_codon:yes gene_type:complete
MSKDQKKNLPINYTNREFSGIRDDLMELAERFYPDTFQDFSEASFGAMMIDAVAYVGDQMSLHLDYNINESFLDTAYQLGNVLRHGRVLGYKDPGRPSTFGEVALYIMVPASSTGMGPDTAYIPILSRGTSFLSDTGLKFVLTENVNFADEKNSVVVAQVDNTTGAPTRYAIKAYGNVVSGDFAQKDVKVGAYERFRKVSLNIDNLSEIISVFDAEGNEYFEVDYLAQDMVYKELKNKNYKNDNVPSILKPMLVSRKYVVERTATGYALQFGSGEDGGSGVVAQPQSIALDVFGKSYVTDTTFDPTRLTKNQSFGIVPSNTTLTVVYRTNNPTNSNVGVGSLKTVANARLIYQNKTSLSVDLVNQINTTIEVSNETPIVGDITNPSTSEIKRRIYDTFPTQNRAVTQTDYESLATRMPGKFGSIKRVSAQKDNDSQKRNINLYIISEDSFGKLIESNGTIKQNLKTWLNQHRMINDTVDILDAYIINIGVEFVIKTVDGANKSTALASAIRRIADRFSEGFFIGEPIYISDIYSELKKEPDVLDVLKVKIVPKTGGSYSYVDLQVNKNLSPDGSYLMCPKNAIFELKFPQTDVKGKVR